MDSSDVSLAIRRARRNNAKSLDLSRRGLRAWPSELFNLRQLESLDLSGNELSSVDPNLAQLEALEEMDLSGNKLETLPSAVVSTLRSLRSLVLDGNPCAAALSPSQLRQLARPGRVPGQSPAQVIAGYLSPQGDLRDDMEVPAPPPPPPEEAASFREPVRESKPSWLSDRGSLAATLPSRRGLGALNQEDEATDLRNQLKEEQRRNKRLEQQVQRLSDRLSEQSMTGSKGSLPHFEMVEVQLGEILSQGGFSVVHKGTWHGTKVAVKKLFDPNISHELLAEFDNEVDKLELLRHPNILMPLALHRKPPALCLIMELVEGGSYYQLLHTQQFAWAQHPMVLSLQEHMNILDPAATALAFLHARGIAHRDIKSHNVLLSPHLEVKLCDFGLSRLKSELMTGTMQFAGTPSYMAPEVFRNAKYTESVDVFAFGTLLWEVMANDIPFANLDPADIRDRVIEGRMLEMPGTAPREMQQLIRSCWTLDYKVRPLMPEVLKQLRGLKEGSRRPKTATGTRPGRFD